MNWQAACRCPCALNSHQQFNKNEYGLKNKYLPNLCVQRSKYRRIVIFRPYLYLFGSGENLCVAINGFLKMYISFYLIILLRVVEALLVVSVI